MLVLQFHNFPKVVQPQDGWFPSVPGKVDHGSGGGVDMLGNVSLKDIVRHTKGRILSIKVFLFQIITVAAVEITDGAGRLGKNLKFAGRFSHESILSILQTLTKHNRRRHDKIAFHERSIRKLTLLVKEKRNTRETLFTK
jgi:hypothetical protein